MTRGETPTAGFEYRSFGAPGAGRTVFLLREGEAATLDPDPAVTARRDVRVVAVRVTADDIEDPAAYRGATPAAMAASAIARLVTGEAHDEPVGLVGIAGTGELALMLAHRLGAQVDRLVLVAVAEPVTGLDRDEVGDLLGEITAKTLILNGRDDPDAATAAARWHQSRLPDARVEIVPETAARADPRLSISHVWERVLSHAAPGTVR
jgi:pimeloyl-ACP methyl ester carboxylesterase